MSESFRQSVPTLEDLRGDTVGLEAQVAAGVPERFAFINGRFADNPYDTHIWNEAIDNAAQEESTGVPQPAEIADISVQDLAVFAGEVYSADVRDRYTLMAQTAPNGKAWFDVFPGFTNPNANKTLGLVAQHHAKALGRDKLSWAVDLGSGSGNAAGAIAPYAHNVTGIDYNHALVGLARQKHPGPTTNFEKGDVTKLAIAENSVDFVSCANLLGALDEDSAKAMFRNVSRILKPGGIFVILERLPAQEIVKGYSYDDEQIHPEFNPEELKACYATWKVTLTDMIAYMANGKFENPGKSLDMEGADWEAFKDELGLHESRPRVAHEDGMVTTIPRIFTKAV